MNFFSNETWLFGLAGLPVIAAVIFWSEYRRKRRLARLIDTSLHSTQIKARGSRSRAWRSLVLLGALGAAVVALARPLGDETTQPFSRSGRDVVFVVDVSRSMLAEDLTPNRLERAKQIVRDGLGVLRGDRVAIVAFAGSAVVKCPLTTDTAFARLVVDELSTESVSRGGSLIGDALRSAVDSLFPEVDDGRVRDIVLITDGEDHGSFPIDAAASLTDQSARLITVGLGLPSGAPVPAGDGRVLRHEGEAVVSSLDSATLEQMARTTEGGVYLPVGDGYIEFDRVYAGLARTGDAVEDESQTSRRAELFQWPLGLAFVLLSIERVLRER